jgi:Tfp pilus assembly protein PilF
MNRAFSALIVATLLPACASSPWPHYETAMSCHMVGEKMSECDKHYRKAMKEDPKLQGIHASYGVHLLKQGRIAEANREFAIEQKNYPAYAVKPISQLTASKPNDKPKAGAQ